MNKTVSIKSTARPYRKGETVIHRECRRGRLTVTRCMAILSAVSAFLSIPVNVYATNEATFGLTSLAFFISGIVNVIGIILALISFTILGSGFSQHDTSQVKMGLMSLAGAVIMIFHMQLLGIMGISI